MNRIKQLAAPLAVAMALTTFVSTSAFADSRPRNETRQVRYGYNDNSGIVRGVVQRVDYRRNAAVIRGFDGRFVTVVMPRSVARRSRVDINDLRRGDRVTLTGDWNRGVFEAYRVASIR